MFYRRLIWLKYGLLSLSINLFSQTAAILPDSLANDTLLTDNQMQVTPAFKLESGESAEQRWIVITASVPQLAESIRKPIIMTNGSTGEFSWCLDGVDTTTYLGNRMLQDHGHYPIYYTVQFPASNTIMIQGKTLPYDDMNCFYSFQREEYRLEFLFAGDQQTDLAGSAPLLKTDVDKINKTKQLTSSTNHPTQSESAAYFELFMKALRIASIALIVVVLLLLGYFLVRSLRRQTASFSKPFSAVLDDKTIAESGQINTGGEALVLTPEQQEEQIRQLMERDSIGYDEAALRVQYASLDGSNVSGK